MTSSPRHQDDATAPEQHDVEQRSQLLPEELTAGGSEDPRAQAEAILAESRQRTEHPDPEDSTQSSRRSSDETV